MANGLPDQYILPEDEQEENQFSFATGEGMELGEYYADPNPDFRPDNLMAIHQANVIDLQYKLDDYISGNNETPDLVGGIMGLLPGFGDKDQSVGGIEGFGEDDVYKLTKLRDTDPEEYARQLEVVSNRISSQQLETETGFKRTIDVLKSSFGAAWSSFVGTESEVVSNVEEIENFRQGIEQARSIVGDVGATAYAASRNAVREHTFSRTGQLQIPTTSMGVNTAQARELLDKIEASKQNPDDEVLRMEIERLSTEIENDAAEWKVGRFEALQNNLLRVIEERQDRTSPELSIAYQAAQDANTAIGISLDQPLNTTLQTIAASGGQSAISMAVAILGAGLGGIALPGIGGTAGAGAAGGAATFEMSYNAMFVDELLARGVDITNVDNLANVITPELIDSIDKKIRPAAQFSGAVAGGQMALATRPLAIFGRQAAAESAGQRALSPALSAQNTVLQTGLQAATDMAEAGITPILMGEDEFGSGGAILQAGQANLGMAAIEPVQTGAMRLASGGGERLGNTVRSLRERRLIDDQVSAIDQIIEDLGDNTAVKAIAEETARDILEGTGGLEFIEQQLDATRAALEETGSIESLPDLEAAIPSGVPDAVELERPLETQPTIEEIYPDPHLEQIVRLRQAKEGLRETARESREQFGEDSEGFLAAMEGIRTIEDIEQTIKDGGLTDAETIGLPTRQKIKYTIRNQERIAAIKEDGDAVFVSNGTPVAIDTILGKGEEGGVNAKVGEREVAKVLETLSDPEADVETKLKAVIEGYVKGIVASTTVRDAALDVRFEEALKSADADTARKIAGMDESFYGPLKNIISKTKMIEANSTSTLDSLTNVWRGGERRGGTIEWMLDKLPDFIYNRKSNTPTAPRTKAGKAANEVSKFVARSTQQFGARGGAARLVAAPANIARRRAAVLNEVRKEIENKQKGIFPRRMTNEQLSAVNDYMREPTAANQQRVREFDVRWVAALDERREFRKALTNLIKEVIPADDKLIEIFDKNMDGYWHTAYAFKSPDVAKAKATPRQRQMVKNAIIERFEPEALFNPSRKSLKNLGWNKLRQLASLRNVPNVGTMDKDQLVDAIVNKGHINEKGMEFLVNRVITEAQTWASKNFEPATVVADEKISSGRKATILSKEGELRNKAALEEAARGGDMLALALQAVYGKLRHPDDVFQTTVVKMVDMLENYQSAQGMINLAFELGMATLDPDKSGFDTSLEAAGEHGSFGYRVPGQEGTVPPKNIYVSEELKDMFDMMFRSDRPGTTALDKALRGWIAINGLYKYMYTVANLPAHVRNTASAMIILMRNGTALDMLRPRSLPILRDSLMVLINDALSTGAEGTAGGWNELKHLMIDRDILHNSPKGGTLEDYRNDFMSMLRGWLSDKDGDVTQVDTFFKKWTDKFAAAGADALGTGAAFLEGSYRYTDEGPKMLTFLNNRAFYANLLQSANPKGGLKLVAGMPAIIKQGVGTTVTMENLAAAGIDQTQENLAAVQKQLDWINDVSAIETIQTTPTYSMVGPYMKALRTFPVIGAFPSFTSEVYRNHVNAIQMARMSAADAVKGSIKIVIDGKEHDVSVSRALLGTRAMTQATGLALDAAATHTARAVTTAFATAGEDQEDSELFMQSIQQLMRAPFTGEDNDARDLTTIGKLLSGPFTDQYGLLPVAIDEDTNTITYIDVSYTHPNAPIYSGAAATIDAVRKWRNPEGNEDFSAIGAMWDVTQKMAGPMIGLEPGTSALVNLVFRQGRGSAYQDAEITVSTMAREFLNDTVPAWAEKVVDDLNRANFRGIGETASGTRVIRVKVDEAVNNYGNGLRTSMRAHRASFLTGLQRAVSPASGLDVLNQDSSLDEEALVRSYIRWRQEDGRAFTEARRLSKLVQEHLGISPGSMIDWLSSNTTDQQVGLPDSVAAQLVRGEEGSVRTMPFNWFEREDTGRIWNDFVAGQGTGLRKKLPEEMLESAKANLDRAVRIINSLDRELRAEGTVNGIPLFEYNL